LGANSYENAPRSEAFLNYQAFLARTMTADFAATTLTSTINQSLVRSASSTKHQDSRPETGRELEIGWHKAG